MNYQFHYDRLVEKHGSWLKPKGVYTERHRKLPGYLGGKYIFGNAFYMSARAHYLAHLLWAKITGHQKAWRAIVGMNERLSLRKSKIYERARKEAADYQSELVSGENNYMYGRTHTDEARRLISQKNLGRTHTEEARLNMSRAQTGRKHAEETKRKIGAKSKGRTASVETRKKQSIARKGKPLNPEHANKVKQSLAACGKSTSSQRWKCDECEIATTPGALANHQTGSGHKGKTRLS